MTFGLGDGEAAAIIDVFRDQMQAIAEAQQKRVKLIASATSADKAVTITVNAEGTVIATEFGAASAKLGRAELAAVVTRTAQEAVAEMQRLSNELLAPIAENRDRLPKLSEVIEGMPDFAKEIPMEPPVSVDPPEAAKAGEKSDAGVRKRRQGGPGVSRTVW